MYKILNNDTIRDYVDEVPEIRDLLLGSEESVAKLEISEIGDGNLNFVYIVKAGDRSVILKQAVPYLRCVGEEYPLSRIRMTFEIEALKREKEICPEFVPDIYYSSHDMSLVVMQNLSQHKILRAEMINRVHFPLLSEHISTFLADTLFYTSDLYMKSDAKKEGVAKFINIELCKITEDFVFTHPYEDNETNEYNPKLDMALVKKFREDKDVKMAVLGMKYKFMTNAQALLHGDLHSGSIMLNQKETFVIDPEFAFYGPIAFDVGIYLANLIMSYLSLDGDDSEYGDYVSTMIVDTWDMFSAKFKENMMSHEKEIKSLQFDYLNGLACLDGYVNNFIDDLFEDSIGFVACEMFRRTVGLAKVADIADIPDLKARAKAEEQVLRMGSYMVVHRHEFTSIQALTDLAKSISPLNGVE